MRLCFSVCGASKTPPPTFGNLSRRACATIHANAVCNSCRCDPSQRLPFVSFSSRLRDISNFAEREIYRNCRGEYRGNYIERRSAPYIDRPRRLARSAFCSTKGKEYRDGCVFETARTKNEWALTSFLMKFFAPLSYGRARVRGGRGKESGRLLSRGWS